MKRGLSIAVAVFAVSVLCHDLRAELKLEERLGQILPGSIKFEDDLGAEVIFESYIDKPTIFAPIYIKCSTACPMNLGHLSWVLSELKLVKPGKDFQVAAVSFNKDDTHSMAADKKKDYIAAVGENFPEASWKFLVGDQANIDVFLEGVGYGVEREGNDFAHPVGLVIVSRDRKIVRYFVGSGYSPIDLTMAINEAAQGRIGSTTNRILNFCFSYDPAKKKYTMNLFRLAGGLIIIFVAAVGIFLTRSHGKRA